MVVLNNNETEQKLDLKRFAESLDGFSGGKDIISGKDISFQGSLSVRAKSSMIIELK